MQTAGWPELIKYAHCFGSLETSFLDNFPASIALNSIMPKGLLCNIASKKRQCQRTPCGTRLNEILPSTGAGIKMALYNRLFKHLHFPPSHDKHHILKSIHGILSCDLKLRLLSLPWYCYR